MKTKISNIQSKDKDNNDEEEEEEDSTFDLIPKSIIYEEPELTTRIEYEDPKQTKMQKFNNKFKKGSMINSITFFFSYSPYIMFIFIPYALIKTGYILFACLVIISSLSSMYTTHLLLRIKADKHVVSFHQLLSQLIGRRVCMFYHSMYIIYLFGMTLMYLLISKSLFFIIFNSGEVLYNIIFHLAGLICFQLPCSFIQSIDKLRTIELIFMLGILLSGIICSIDSLVNMSDLPNIDQSYLEQYYTPFNYGYGFTIAILTLTFNNQMQFYPEIRQLKLFTAKRGNFFITRTVIFQILWCIVFGILCYLNYTNIGSPLIFFEYSLAIKERSAIMRNIYYAILFYIILFLQFKLGQAAAKIMDNAFESRSSSSSMISCYSSKLNTNKGMAYSVYPVLILVAINIFFYLVPNKVSIHKGIIGVIGIVGGIISSVLCLIFPIYCFNQLYYEKMSSPKRFFHIVFIGLFFTFGIFATVSSIILIA